MQTLEITRQRIPAFTRTRRVLAGVWKAYLAGWVWYVGSGHAPPGDRGFPNTTSMEGG